MPIIGTTIVIFSFSFFSMIVILIFIPVTQKIGVDGLYLIFGILTLICIIYLYFIMKETSGLSHDEILKLFKTEREISELKL